MPRRDTLVHRIHAWALERPDTPALHDREGEQWEVITWSEYWTAVRETAKGLIALGHAAGDCVAIVGDNRSEWVIAQFGIMAAAGVPAPIYVTNTPAQMAYIVEHSRSTIAFASSKELGEKLPKVDHLIHMDEVGAMTLRRLRELGRGEPDDELDRRLDALTDTQTALLIYTSGTTGVPKAVTLDHTGMILCGEGIASHFPDLMVDAEAYRAVSYLPLCHVAEQVFTNFIHLATGGKVFFCPDLKAIKDYLVSVRPTIFLGVPRVWEKFQGVLEAKLSAQTGVKAKLTSWALATELAAFRRDVETGTVSGGLSRTIANKLVISKVKSALGLQDLVAAATGAAPIGVTTLEFFASLGITVYEGYGMSETTGVATCPKAGRPKFGTVGVALPGVEIRIAEDGEILMRGPSMTRAYLHNPEKTAELLDDEGWLHSGDLGSLDADGSLRITGRKKDLIITAGGKNVAPVELESYIKTIPGVGQAVVVGDRQPYLCALVTLDVEGLDELRSIVGVTGELAELAQDPKVHAHVMAGVEERCNTQVARYQTIKKVQLLPVEFTVEGGQLTPTMKIKRNEVVKMYAAEIDGFYAP
ncbi:MAG: long-chain fatty acid--CoA ligase [Proteobacteria bacterium]|nr:long-chain fatty acid--CoA ligase [Pseudomonadota bacterium]MCP4916549.1 long-chain fatty acid--CoA ligase [Pseudomonadota bacterium]